MLNSSTAEFVHQAGHREGRERGRLEGACRQLRKLSLRLGRLRLGVPPEGSEACLDNLDSCLARERFYELADRLAMATGWSTWLAALAPPPAPPVPDYVAAYEFDPSPHAAGFDETFKVPFLPGAALPPSGRPGKGARYDSQHALIHMRFQKWHEPDLDRKMYRTNHQLRERHKVDHVESGLFLLFKEADGPGVTGKFTVPSLRGKKFAETFTYRIVRVWEKSPEECLNGGFGVAMLAPLSNVTEAQLPAVIQQMEALVARLGKSAKEATMLWSAAYWYMGLRYPADLVNRLLANAMSLLHQDKTYRGMQAGGYVEGRSQGEREGRVDATRTLLLRVGTARFGAPPPEVREAMDATSELPLLEQWAGRVLEAPDWGSVIGERPPPASGSPPGS